MAATLDVTEHGDIHERETLPPTNISEGKKDKTRVAISPIEMRFTRVDMTVANSGEWLDIGEHSMKHEVGDLKGRLGEPRGDMLATVNSMVHVGQQEKLSFQLKVLDKGKPKDRKPKLNCFLCGELHFCRDCPKREELIARIKEYEERQRLEEKPTISEPKEDSTSTKVDGSKETVEELVEPKEITPSTMLLATPKVEEPQRPPQNPVADRGQECMENIPQTETVMKFAIHGSTQWFGHKGGSSLFKGGETNAPKEGTQRKHLVKKRHHTKRTGQFWLRDRKWHNVCRRHEDNLWNFPKTAAIFQKKWRRGRRQIWWGRMSRPAKRDRRRRGRH
ncbi:hypothetical protein Acr_12g0002180 [Actinidia rufa]|uniref:Uncharacterized protein n=1 Tax=Actinidia rufa TaxID=165716 RepID=A0A7J0FIE6_9ERIC|nr:hypothetical protein Acr_12g0002180 [Actinidia rufa]